MNAYFLPANSTDRILDLQDAHFPSYLLFDFFIALDGISSKELFQVFVFVKSNNGSFEKVFSRALFFLKIDQ